MKRLIYILLPLMMLTACETELEYKGPGSDPMLFVYAELLDSAGAENDIFVGHTSFFVNGIDSSRLEDAVIEIARGDGGFVETGAVYVTPDDLRPGEQLRLRINQKDFGTANAMAVCPPKIDVEILSFEEKEREKGARNFDVKLKLLCDGVEVAGDFYWQILAYGHESWVTHSGDTLPMKETLLWESDDPVLHYDDTEENIDLWSMLFGNTLFDYKPIKLKEAEHEASITLKELVTYSYYSGDWEVEPVDEDAGYKLDSIELIIEVASADMVKYLDAKEECENFALNIFKEPSLMYTNMDNGMGLFAIKSRVRKMIILEK